MDGAKDRVEEDGQGFLPHDRPEDQVALVEAFGDVFDTFGLGAEIVEGDVGLCALPVQECPLSTTVRVNESGARLYSLK